MRRVASSWNEAAAETPVEEQIHTKSQRSLECLLKCLPKLKALKVDQTSQVSFVLSASVEHDGDDRDNILNRFHNIHHFECLHTMPSLLRCCDIQNLMSHWQNLRHLNLHGNEDLHWNLSDLASLVHLCDLRCTNNRYLEGNVKDLLLRNDNNGNTRPSDLFYNFIIIDISGCTLVEGTLKDFAKLPKLQWLGVNRTRVTGDLRYDVKPGDFLALQGMGLCDRAVYGASQIQRVQDAPTVMRARLQIMKQSTWESSVYPLMVHLSPDSPDYHARIEQQLYASELDPPFSIETVKAGNHWGWRWSNYFGGFCDVHWVDPEPSKCDDQYFQELADIQAGRSLFAGFAEPPTAEQYQVLCPQRPV